MWRRAAVAATTLGIIAGGLLAPAYTATRGAALAEGLTPTSAEAEAAAVPAADLLDVDFAGATSTDHAQGLASTVWGTPTYGTDPDLGDVLQVTGPTGSDPNLANDAVSFDWAGQWSKINTGFTVECVFRVDVAMPIGSEKDLCSSKEAGGLSIYLNGGNLGTMAHIGGGYKSVLSPIQGNTWHHVLSVWDGTDLTLYVDGSPVGSTPATGAFLPPPNAATHRFVVGGDASPTGVGQYAPPATFAGTRVWSRALNAAEALDAAAEHGFEVQVPDADILDVDFADGTPVDHAQGLTLKTWGAPDIRPDAALGRNVAEFDGVDDALGYQFYEQWDALADGYTMECTFKFDGEIPVGQEEDLCASKEAGGAAIAIYGDQLTFNPHSGGSYRATGVAMESGRWYHAVGTWDGTSSKLYVNGQLAATLAAPGALGKPNATATQFVLAGDAATNGNAQFYAPATISTARIYSQALDVAQVGAVYAAELGDVPGAQVELTRTVPAAGDHLTEPVILEADIVNQDNASGWSFKLDGTEVGLGDDIGPGLRAGDHTLVVTARGVLGEDYRWEIAFTSVSMPTGGGTDSEQGGGTVELSAIAESPDGSDVTTTFREAEPTVAEDGVQGVVPVMPSTLDFEFTEESAISGRQLPEDGATAATVSSRDIPFQRYDIDVSAANGQRIVWSGVADPKRAVRLHAWDATVQKWVKLAESLGNEVGDTVLSSRLRTALVDGGTVHVLVTGVDPFSDDLAPRDESAQDDKNHFDDPESYDFSLAHFTDTQYIAEGAVGGTYNDFDQVEEPSDVMQQVEQDVWQQAYRASTEWIADNSQRRKIAFTAHTGDVTENYISNTSGRPDLDAQSVDEFEFTSDAHDVLEDNGIVNQVIAGNHDNVMGNETGATSRFSQYFSPQRYYDASAAWPDHASFHTWDETADESGNVVTRGQDSQNNYVLFSAGGLDFVSVGLSYGVTQEEADWANSIFERYDDRNGILLTHAYIAPSSKPDGRGASFSVDGNRLFNEVVADNPNVFLVLAGHEHGVGTNVKSDVGVTVSHNVVELLADYQFYTVSAGELWPDKVVNGGVDLNGDGVVDHAASKQLQFGASFLRLLQFDVDRSEVSIDTYSPYFDNFGATEYDTSKRYNGAEDNMVLPVDLETRKTSFETDGLTVVTPTETVIGEATTRSGWPATVQWNGLVDGELYGWVADSRSADGEVVKGLRQFGGIFVAAAAGTDATAPTITLPSDDEVTVGEAFDPLAGVSASDNVDNDVTDRIQVQGLVDTSRPGVYALTYLVSDTNGNQVIASRAVTVVAPVDNRAASTLTVGNLRAVFGSPATISASVSPATARGNLTFLIGEDTLCTAVVAGGGASCQATELPAPGDYVVVASYGGDSAFLPTQRSFVLTVTERAKVDPRLDANVQRDPVATRRRAVLVARLAAAATGEVRFTSKGRTLCVAQIRNGKATCSTKANLKPGRYNVTATYAGDGAHLRDRDRFVFRKLRR